MAAAAQSPGADRLDVNWEEIEHSPEFKELVSKRRSFVLPATIFFLVWYMAFILLAGYATDFMTESVYQGLTVGYCLALTQFVMVLVLGIMYLKRSANVYDPLAEAAVERYARAHDMQVKDANDPDAAADEKRFDRGSSSDTPGTTPTTPGAAR